MRIAVLGCCAIVLLASGCGSGHSSAAAFRTRADTICRELGLQTGSEVSTKAALDRHIRGAEAGFGRLARLHPPNGDARSYRDLIATLRQTMSLARTSFPALIAAKHPSRQAVERVVRPLEREIRRADSDARAVGLHACSSQPQDGPTPRQVKSPAKRAFDRQMLAVSDRYMNALSRAAAPFAKAFHTGQRERVIEKVTLAMSRKEAGIYDDEASAVARIRAPADARKEQQTIAAAYRVASKQAAEFAVSYRHHGHTSLPEYLRVDWQGRMRVAVRRLEANGYALDGFGALGWLTVSSGSKIVKPDQP